MLLARSPASQPASKPASPPPTPRPALVCLLSTFDSRQHWATDIGRWTFEPRWPRVNAQSERPVASSGRRTASWRRDGNNMAANQSRVTLHVATIHSEPLRGMGPKLRPSAPIAQGGRHKGERNGRSGGGGGGTAASGAPTATPRNPSRRPQVGAASELLAAGSSLPI